MANSPLPLLRRMTACASIMLAALSAACSAEPQRLPVPVAEWHAPAPQVARPALWKLADSDTTIYLFGTIHALPKGLEWFGGPLSQALDASGELVTEIEEGSPAEMQRVVGSKALLPAGQDLRSMLTAPDRAAYENAMKANGLPVESFDRFEPWYAAIGLATVPLLRSGYDTENGVEAQLRTRTQARGLPRHALETAEYQLGLFDSLPMDVQKTYLRDVVDHLPELRGDLAQIIDAWRLGQADRLAELMNADEDDPAMVEALLINRNRNWAGWIKSRMDRPGVVFVAVGAGHLAGKGSVQEQLQAAGLRITRAQ